MHGGGGNLHSHQDTVLQEVFQAMTRSLIHPEGIK